MTGMFYGNGVSGLGLNNGRNLFLVGGERERTECVSQNEVT